jgi:hypothetical protein
MLWYNFKNGMGRSVEYRLGTTRQAKKHRIRRERRKRISLWLLEFFISLGVVLSIKIFAVNLIENTNTTNAVHLIFKYISHGDLACIVVVTMIVLLILQNHTQEKVIHRILTLVGIIVVISSAIIVGATALSSFNELNSFYFSVIIALIALISGTMILYFQVPSIEEGE